MLGANTVVQPGTRIPSGQVGGVVLFWWCFVLVVFLVVLFCFGGVVVCVGGEGVVAT